MFGLWLVDPWVLKTGGDDDAAQFDGRVLEGRLGLGGVPALAGALLRGLLGVVAVAGVPEHGQAVGDQAERYGALDGGA